MEILELIKKYRSNSLTVDDLEEMRFLLNTLSLQEIEDAIKELDKEDEMVGEPVASAELVARVREKISDEIDRLSRMQPEDAEQQSIECVKRGFNWKSVVAAAACLIAVIAVGFAAYFSRSTDKILASTGYTEISTRFGEKSRVTLPDGTEVRLMGRSKLRYPSDMAVGERRVEFNGEAYFKVTKDPEHPFSVVADDLIINVKGTEFNVYARPEVGYDEVILDKGKIDLTARNTTYKVSLNAGESVMLDKKNGIFEITSFRSNPSLRRRVYGITYNNVPADSLVRALERTFEVKISDDIEKSINSPFTGTLPDDDLNESLTILSKIYGFNVPYIHKN